MKSQLMTQADLLQLQARGKTLEQDKHGIKVTILPNGNMLKVFRLHGWFSSSLIYSNARSFCRNALRLKELGILTVDIISLHHLERRNFTAVIYTPLAGETVRHLLGTALANKDMFEKLGIFIASLHNKGVYFRSMHLGNVVYYQGDLGLIDIADMRIYPWQLFFSTRKRNFNRMMKYKADMLKISAAQKIILIQSYLVQSSVPIKKQQVLLNHFTAPRFQSS